MKETTITKDKKTETMETSNKIDNLDQQEKIINGDQDMKITIHIHISLNNGNGVRHYNDITCYLIN